jgi:hypothetical protein
LGAYGVPVADPETTEMKIGNVTATWGRGSTSGSDDLGLWFVRDSDGPRCGIAPHDQHGKGGNQPDNSPHESTVTKGPQAVKSSLGSRAAPYVN